MRIVSGILILIAAAVAVAVSAAKPSERAPECDAACHVRRRDVMLTTESERVEALRAELGLGAGE